jgi:uncharacterized protein
MNHYFIIPGLGNSGPEHWQTYFEQSGPNFSRIEQQEWDAPVCDDWVSTVQQAVSTVDPASVILIGHSLGCATIAHWANRYQVKIKGAMLVAPSDLEAPVYTFPAKGFAPFPLERIPFPTLTIASEDDPWVSMERARYFATCWGSELISLGNAGHINASSGYGEWEQGLELLKKLG